MKFKSKKIILNISTIYHGPFNRNQIWYKNHELHREDGPALIYVNGDKFWYKNGKLHREEEPAVIYSNGDKFWYKNDRHIKSKCQ
jgi:hypothetical protein